MALLPALFEGGVDLAELKCPEMCNHTLHIDWLKGGSFSFLPCNDHCICGEKRVLIIDYLDGKDCERLNITCTSANTNQVTITVSVTSII